MEVTARSYCAMLAAATQRRVVGTDVVSTGASIGAALLTVTKPEQSPGGRYRNLVNDSVEISVDGKLSSYSQAWSSAVSKRQLVQDSSGVIL